VGRVIADRYFAQRLTVPFGTPSSAPLLVPFPVDDLILVAVDLRIPDGAVGLTGFAIEYAGRRIVPWGDDTAWIQGNNDELSFSVNFEVGTEVVFVLYNEGAYDHAFYTRMQFRYLPAVDPNAAPALALVV
jgi:hypothetical protein